MLRSATGARPSLPSVTELASVRYTPITLPFRQLGLLSRQIAVQEGLYSSAESERAAGLLIDVAELWELFLVYCARRAFGAANVDHGTTAGGRRHLLESVARDGERRLGNLKPDVIVRDDRHPVLFIDAKYKLPCSTRERPSGVDPADLYQLTAYVVSHALPAPARGALAFPEGKYESGLAVEAGPWRSTGGHLMGFERLPLDAAGCCAELRDLSLKLSADGLSREASARDEVLATAIP